jgi:hypothetical protein
MEIDLKLRRISGSDRQRSVVGMPKYKIGKRRASVLGRGRNESGGQRRRFLPKALLRIFAEMRAKPGVRLLRELEIGRSGQRSIGQRSWAH